MSASWSRRPPCRRKSMPGRTAPSGLRHQNLGGHSGSYRISGPDECHRHLPAATRRAEMVIADRVRDFWGSRDGCRPVAIIAITPRQFPAYAMRKPNQRENRYQDCSSAAPLNERECLAEEHVGEADTEYRNDVEVAARYSGRNRAQGRNAEPVCCRIIEQSKPTPARISRPAHLSPATVLPVLPP